MGRTWDEMAQVEKGYRFIELAKKGDFTNFEWIKNPDHPPLKDYLYGFAGYLDIERIENGKPVYRYDITYSRLISVLFAGLTVVIVMLLGWEFVSPFVGVTAGTILAMLPFYLGLTQLATIESPLIFFFTSTLYFFFKFLKRFSVELAIAAGILMGLAFSIKFTNILLIPLVIGIFFLWIILEKKKIQTLLDKKFLVIFITAFIVFFILWPMPWFSLSHVLEFNNQMRFENVSHSIPEVLFGKVRLTPVFYYTLYFFITIPVAVPILFLLGTKRILSKRNFILIAMLIWFAFPFLQSFYKFRQHNLRYIIEIYAPLALITALGLESVAERFTKNFFKKLLFVIPLILYLFILLARISPYYLDYFNELVGGPAMVYKYNLFQLGWWGQGIKEAVLYLEENAKSGSRVGLVVSPIENVPHSVRVKTEKYKDSGTYDYVIVGVYDTTRLGFEDTEIKKNYKPIYYVDADGAKLMTVYKRK
jgi:4-amino-4-deoxy-L-arabinose transferase-like glycosyltransferase